MKHFKVGLRLALIWAVSGTAMADEFLVDSLGQATPSTRFSVFGSAGLLLTQENACGPAFTLDGLTIIKEVGGFVDGFRTIQAGVPDPNLSPLIVSFYPALGGLPDLTQALATFELSEDGDPLTISYEFVQPDLVLGPGSYFALFSALGEDRGMLLENHLLPPSGIDARYWGDSVVCGFGPRPTTELRHAAVRVVTQPIPDSGSASLLMLLGSLGVWGVRRRFPLPLR